MSIPDCPFSDGWTDEELETMTEFDRLKEQKDAIIRKQAAPDSAEWWREVSQRLGVQLFDATNEIRRLEGLIVNDAGTGWKQRAQESPKAFQCERCGIVYFQKGSSCVCGAVVLKTPREIFKEQSADMLSALRTARELLRGDSIFEETFAEEIEQLDAALRKASERAIP